MLTTTLRELRQHDACEDRYEYGARKLGSDFGDDDTITLLQILDSNGLADALWALRACDMTKAEERQVHEFACMCAEHFTPAGHPGHKLLVTKRQWLAGEISDGKLDNARATYWAACWVVYWATDRAAYWVAYWATDRAADRVAEWIADRAADRAADRTTEWRWQSEKLREMLDVI